MLTISPQASEAIEALMSSPTVPDGAGLRLMQGPVQGGGDGIGIAVVDHAEPEDQVIECTTGAEVFVEPETAELLDDKELDAELTGNQVAFSLRPQAGLDGG